MAIVWGAWNSTTRLRTGIEVTMSPTTVTSATTSVTVTVKVYMQTYYASYETGSSTNWWISGGVAASGNFDWNLGAMGTILAGQTSHVVNLTYGSTQSKSYTGQTKSFYAYPGVITSASTSITIPARPYAAPSAPSSASVARTSDTSHTVTWDRVASAAAPVQDSYVERWDNVSGAYSTVASIGTDYTTSASQSYTDNTTIADRQYRYRVRVKNSSGYSGYTYTDYIKTTPAAPGAPSATKDATGNINLSWSGNSAIGENVEVWDSPDGGAKVLVATVGMVTSYQHAAPNASQTHRYSLKTKIASPALTSGFSGESQVVQLLAPPNAPTNLSPNGEVKDAALDVTLAWQHNPVDTTPQRKKQMQYRVNGGAWNDAGVATSSDPTWSIPAAFFTNGTTVEWQVRTWGSATTGGSDGTGESPWSTAAVITLSSKPTVTINTPADASVVNTATVSVTWGYFDAEGTTQSQWNASLFETTGGVWTALETQSGGSETSTTFATAVKDGHSYTVQVQVRDSTGLLSDADVAAFTVDYAPPPVPVAMVTWDEPNGVVFVDASIDPAGVGEIDPVYYRVWRSEDQGLTWVLAVDFVSIGATAIDHIPPLNTDVQYRVEAVSATPSSSMSGTVGVFTDCSEYNRHWLNFGPNFGNSVYLSSNVHVGVASSRAKVLQQYAGRELPVEYAAVNRERSISVKGTLFTARVSPDAYARSSTWSEIEDAVVNSSAPACLRDLYGHRWFVSTNAASWDGGAKKTHSVSFSCDEIDYHEPTEQEV